MPRERTITGRRERWVSGGLVSPSRCRLPGLLCAHGAVSPDVVPGRDRIAVGAFGTRRATPGDAQHGRTCHEGGREIKRLRSPERVAASPLVIQRLSSACSTRLWRSPGPLAAPVLQQCRRAASGPEWGRKQAPVGVSARRTRSGGTPVTCRHLRWRQASQQFCGLALQNPAAEQEVEQGRCQCAACYQ